MRRLEETAIRPKPDFAQLRKTLLRDGKPDYVPFYELFVNLEIQEPVLGKRLPDRVASIEFYHKAGYDYVPTWPLPPWVFGSLVDRSQGYPIKDRASFESYPWPRPEAISYAEYEAVGPVLPDGMMMMAQTCGVLETAEQLLGYEQLCYALMDDPDLCEAIFKHIEEVYTAMYSTMASIEGVGACVISDDLGFKTQTLIGVDELRRYVLPVHKKLAEIIHRAGKPALLHSCGNLSEIMEDIIEDVRVDAKHSYEDAILPVEEAKRLYGDRLTILGGFDLDRLCRSSEAEVRAYTRKLVTELGANGGYALGSGNSIAAYVPVENYLAMLDEGWRIRES